MAHSSMSKLCSLPQRTSLWSRRTNERRTFSRTRTVVCRLEGSKRKVDVVLSSGFLAFAKHSGFLMAVEQSGLEIGGIMGTSAGAYVGSLYCAGYSPKEVAANLCAVPPIELLRPNWMFWNGFICLEAVVERLRELLPPTFEDLDSNFCIGVVDCKGKHRILDSGPLPEAVAASGAIPVLFAPVDIAGLENSPFLDGGMADRVGLKIWRKWRRNQLAVANSNSNISSMMNLIGSKPQKSNSVPDALVHLISRSSPFSGDDNVVEMGERKVAVVKSTKSGVNFLDMGDYEGQMLEVCDRALITLDKVSERVMESDRVLID